MSRAAVRCRVKCIIDSLYQYDCSNDMMNENPELRRLRYMPLLSGYALDPHALRRAEVALADASRVCERKSAHTKWESQWYAHR